MSSSGELPPPPQASSPQKSVINAEISNARLILKNLFIFLIQFIAFYAFESRAESYHRAIIFVPGFKGSELVETGSDRVAWLSLQEVLLGDRSLALSHPDFPVANALQLRPTSVLRSLPYVPPIFERALYGSFLEFLRQEFGRTHHIVELPYDWRRSNVIASAQLVRVVSELRDGGFTDISIIGHSMGGVVLAHALTSITPPSGELRLIFVATPFGGAPSLLGDLTNDSSSIFNSKLLSRETFCSFESVYELIPSDPIVLSFGRDRLEKFDPNSLADWKRRRFGCFDLAESDGHNSFGTFLGRQLRSSRRFRSSIYSPHLPLKPAPKILNIVGTGLPTSNGCRVEEFDKNRPLNCYHRSVQAPGDGIVTGLASKLPESFTQYMKIEKEFPGTEHLQLMFEDGPRDAIRDFISSGSAGTSAPTF